MTYTQAEPPPAWRRFALALSMFLSNGANGFLQPFVSLYLIAAGLDKRHLGIVLALGTGMALVIQPLLGRVSDKFDARRPFMVLAGIVAAFAYLSYRRVDGFWAFTVLTALGVNGFQYLNAVGGVLVGRLVRASGDSRGAAATYIAYRVWGSVGYIVIGIGAGLLVNKHLLAHATAAQERAQLDPLFTYGPMIFLIIAVVALVVPDAKAEIRPSPLSHSLPGPLTNVAEPLPSNSLSNLDWFLIAYFLYQFALYGATVFLPLYMKSLGATPLWITAMFSVGVISEVTVMTQVGRWSDRFGRRPALVGAFLLMPIRLLLYIPATGPLWVLAVQSMHGFNFGIIGTIAVVVINDHAHEHNRGTLQARLAATACIGNALGPLACGWISEKYGISAMFGWMSVIGFAAAWLMWSKVRESHPEPETPPGLLRRLA